MPSARRSRPGRGRGPSPSTTTTPSAGCSATAAFPSGRPSTWTPSAPRTSAMARRADRRFLLDTSAVIYQLHGHTLQMAAVAEATAGGTVEVPVFVRMEYLRSVVYNLIDMHSLIKESVTVEDALIDWS